jgi:DNA-binding transcriptional ArsR family regulator
MVLHQVLDHVFSTWSRIAVLRALKDIVHPLSGREVARQSGMSHRSCLQALSALEDLRLIVRQRGGRDHLFSLNREHRLVQDGILPLFEVEAGFTRAVRDTLARQLKKEVLSLVLFGSVARKEESPRSDMDLCLIVPTSAVKEKVLEKVHAVAPTVLQQYGVRISPIAFSLREFRLGARRHRSPVREIISEEF